MKGLMIKDLLLVKNQGHTVLLFVFCGVIMGFSMDPELAVGYMAMLGALLSLGTLSYDEYEGGYTYLFSLPVTRKMYVRAKYLFCVGSTLAGSLTGVVISLIVSIARGQMAAIDIPELMIAGLMSLCAIGVIMVGIMIPARLKYGSEKSRLVLFAIFGIIVVIIFAVTKSDSFMPAGLAENMAAFSRFMNSTAGLIAGVIVMIILLLVSEQASERIMEKKEY